MTDPTENEEINEELSTDELKSVVGSFGVGDVLGRGEPRYGDKSSSLRNPIDPKGSGSGMTNEDYKKSKADSEFSWIDVGGTMFRCHTPIG